MTYVPQQSDFPILRFFECSLFFFQLVQATFSCPPAARAVILYNMGKPHVSSGGGTG